MISPSSQARAGPARPTWAHMGPYWAEEEQIECIKYARKHTQLCLDHALMTRTHRFLLFWGEGGG